jgi:hypothetical protein
MAGAVADEIIQPIDLAEDASLEALGSYALTAKFLQSFALLAVNGRQ